MDARGGAGWRDIIRDQVSVQAASAREKSNGDSATIRLSRIHFSVEAHPFLVRAAQQRGISISGYIRRATMARVAADLGIDPIELFKLDSAIRSLGTRDNSRLNDRDLDGELYGRWEVGCDDARDERQ